MNTFTDKSVKTYAAIDCGTNDIRLLIASREENGNVLALHRQSEVVRLGEGVDSTMLFTPEAIKRTIAKVEEFAKVCANFQVDEVRFIATSATRDALNGCEFTDEVTRVLGVVPEVINGVEEARLSFNGATANLNHNNGPFLVVDIGGGSTELALGVERADYICSMDIGAVRLKERILASDPPSPAEMVEARREIAHHLSIAEKQVPFNKVRTLIGVGESVSVVARMANDRSHFEGNISQSAFHVVTASNEVFLRTTEQRIALELMDPLRADVTGAGALIWQSIVKSVVHASRNNEIPVVATEHDLLDGIILDMVVRS